MHIMGIQKAQENANYEKNHAWASNIFAPKYTF